jgi:UDP-3-O-[3-hydroxymyristoyl] glucosamine N-acyltransferase
LPEGRPLAELARRIEAELLGEGTLRVRRVRPLETARAEDLSFVTDASMAERARSSGAGALLAPPDLAEALGGGERPLLLVPDPKLALTRLLPLFHPPKEHTPGIHPTAIVEEGATVDPTAHVGPYAVIGAGSRIGAGAVVGAHGVLGTDCELGAGTVLHPHVVLYDGTRLGERVEVHSGVVLGSDGFGYTTHRGAHLKVPQVGVTVVEDDVEIGANSTIDRAALEETRIGAGSKIDNLVQVGHNVTTGRGCILCGQAGIAGSARLGEYVVLAGQAGVAGHLEIGDGTQVGAKSAVLQSVPGGRRVAGIPAIHQSEWKRQALMFPRLRELARRLRAVERRLEESPADVDSQSPDSQSPDPRSPEGNPE